MILAAAATSGTGILCTILLIATIIAFVVGLAEAIGVTHLTGRVGNGRFGTLLIAVVLLVVYLVVC